MNLSIRASTSTPHRLWVPKGRQPIDSRVDGFFAPFMSRLAVGCSPVGSLCLRSASLDEDDISVFDNVVLAFRHDLSFRPNLILVPKLFQYVVIEDYALDERLFEVCRAR